VLAILATYAALRFSQRTDLRQPIRADIDVPKLSRGGMLAAAGIVGTAFVLLGASALDLQLGLPTFLAGLATAILVLVPGATRPGTILKNISWGVLPLVAGLFVLVAALGQTGVVAGLSRLLDAAGRGWPAGAAWGAGLALGFGVNLVNNLPAGLLAGHAVQAAQATPRLTGAVLLGVDLGPNLSVTGSLATILWLTALRREGLRVTAWQFLKLGALIMPPSLALAILGLIVTG
jgi:arsenical pump membrane protein